jgi:hypothetical protein
LEMFWEIFWIFLNFLGICLEDFFGGIFWRNSLGGIFWEEFFGRNFLGGFLGGFFGRNSLGGILCFYWYWLVCQDFGFCQDFV